KSVGIRDGQRVLLYMPTWRENEKSIFSELDLSRLKKELGDEWVVLVRGHAMNSKSRSTFSTAGIVDVSTVNDPAILYLLANVLVTDYSSSMFDFTITGKPVAFFVPDIERYRDELRGMYLDRKSTRLNSSHVSISYAVFCLKKKNNKHLQQITL